MTKQNEVIGGYKEFILIERETLNELKEKAMEHLSNAENDISEYHKGMTIIDTIEWLKEKNLYNPKYEFEIKG
jgi:hypothetical protein